MPSTFTPQFHLTRFMVSRFLSALSDQFLLFAVPLAIFKSTHNVTYSGLAFIIEWLPRVICFPVAGFFVDRLRAKYLFLGVDIARAALLIMALFLLINGLNTFVVLSITMGLLSIGFVLNFVATEAMLPRNIDNVHLPKAHATLQGIDQITQVAGPALAVVISIWGELLPIISVAATLFTLSAINLLSLHTSHITSKHPMSWKAVYSSNIIALKILIENKVLLHLSALTWVVNLIYGAALVVSAAVVVQVFELSSGHFGLMQTTAAAVSVIIFGLIPRFINKYGLPALGATAFCIMIFSGLVLSASGHFIIYLVGYVALIAFDGVFSVYIRIFRSQVIPQEHLGKASGLLGLINICAIPISASFVTLLSGYFSPFYIFGIIFALATALGVFLVWWGRRLFGYTTWLPSTHQPVLK